MWHGAKQVCGPDRRIAGRGGEGNAAGDVILWIGGRRTAGVEGVVGRASGLRVRCDLRGRT